MCLAPVGWMPEKTRMSGHLVVVGSHAESGQRTRRPLAQGSASPAAPRPTQHGGGSHTGTIVEMAVTSATWRPDSWRERRALQQPAWPDPAAAAASVARLKTSPPLVFAGEARALREQLAKAIDRRAFLLQAGDCVESFNEISTMRIREKLKIMLQMSAVLTYGATLPVVKVGRIAGQFTKPRSDEFEVVGGEEIPSFRGHMVNGDEPVAEARVPDPRRMIEGYNQSASTLNLLRA